MHLIRPRPLARAVIEACDLPEDPPARLVGMGFLTNALNPKGAVFYLAIFPGFVSPMHGSVFLENIQLGITQIAVRFTVNRRIVLTAARLASWFALDAMIEADRVTQRWWGPEIVYTPSASGSGQVVARCSVCRGRSGATVPGPGGW
jgi:hypothetical protein